MRLHDLIKNVYTKPLGPWENFEVRQISCDSREAQENGLFVALPGFKFNGGDFIMDAIHRGAQVIVKDRKKNLKGVADGVCVLDVDDPKLFLRQVAPRFYGQPDDKIKTIGVTGTNGKTTITFLIESIIHASGSRCGVIGTINYHVGNQVFPSKNTTPGFLDNQRFLAQCVALKADYCCMEVSSHALEQGRLDGINFSCGIFTNLTQDHLDYHQTMENYFNAKGLLFKSLAPDAVAIINKDDAYGRRLLSMTRARVMTYAIDQEADIRAVDIFYDSNGSHFDIVFPSGKFTVTTRFIGKHNIYNILASFAWGISQGLEACVILEGIKRLMCVPGRLESVDNTKGFYIFIDYAHTEDGLLNVLKALRLVGQQKIILVFGCGGDRDRSKRAPMGCAACRYADYSIVTSDNPRSEEAEAIINEILPGFSKKNYEVIVDRKEAIKRALALAHKTDIVLIAGKGHEDYQIFKDKTVPFNEREIVSACLQSMKS